MPVTAQARTAAQELIDFIDASPSPWHAVASAEARLQTHGYTRLEEDARWQLAAGGRYYVVRGGASMIAFVPGSQPLAEAGFRIVGAHTDSPGFRVKPKAALAGDGLARLAVEVYGGPILATFTDRDLSLAGRVVLRTAASQTTRLLRFERPLLRLPNLAIHMNRDVNEQGLKLNKQTELPLILGQLGEGDDAEAQLRKLLADAAHAGAADLLSWELAVYDVQKGSLWGANEEFIASRQLDNLASCYAALTALIATEATDGHLCDGLVRSRRGRQRERRGCRRQLHHRRAGPHQCPCEAGRRGQATCDGAQLLHQRRHGPCLQPELPERLRTRPQSEW